MNQYLQGVLVDRTRTIKCSCVEVRSPLWPRIALAVAIILFVATFAQAGPKQQVAVAEAIVWARMHIEPDFVEDKFQSVPQPNDDDTSGRSVQLDSPRATVAGNETDEKQATSAVLGKPVPITPMRMVIQQPVQSAAPSPIETTTIIADWCSWCHKQQKDNGDGNPQMRHAYVDERDIADPELRAIYKAAGSLPITAWRDASDGLRYAVGYQSSASLYAIIQRNNPPTDDQRRIASSGPAGTIHAKAQIEQLKSWWREKIGEGVSVSMSWDRTGAQSFPLLAKGDWSAQALFGNSGRMTLKFAGARNIPVDQFGFTYQVIGNDMVVDPDSMTFKGLAARLGPEQHTEAVGAAPVGLDPGTALMALQIIRSIWSLLHPSCDLQLGGNVSATAVLNGDVLAVDFVQCPSVRITALFSFTLGVKRVEFLDSSVRVIFSGSRFIKERTFSVE